MTFYSKKYKHIVNSRLLTGFTLVELLIVIGIFMVLIALVIPTIRFFEQKSELNNSAEQIIDVLRLAQNKTLTSEQAAQWGVYFEIETDKYVLFKGSSYNPLETDNEIHELSKNIKISEIALEGLGSEVVFERIIGSTNQFGNISLQLKTDTSETKSIYIENSGQIGLTEPLTPSDISRIKDSRHIHFDYSRVIDTSLENLILTFEGSVIKTIVIVDYLKDNQIYWEEEVDVAGEIQQLKIHTHRLNNPDTQFSLHRDRRYNNKSLIVTISGDASGSLINYTNDGQESRGSSIYLAAGEAGDPWQQ